MKRHHKIEGEYISYFEDEIDGKKILSAAPLVLVQKGLRVTGETQLESRKWILQGEITNDKYFHGMYWSATPHDKGVGNFFLEIISNENRKEVSLKGIWSGYDSTNHKIASGEYTCNKKSNINVDIATKANAARIVEITESQLGKDYLSEDIVDFSNNLILKATCKGQVIGCSISVALLTDEFVNSFANITPYVKTLNHIDKVGVIKTVAVSEHYQGKGVGYSLVLESMERLKQEQVDIVIMVGWKSIKGTNIENIALAHNFKIVNEIPEYWSKDSVHKNYSCPVCGNPPCTCSAVIFQHIIDS